MAFSCAAGEAGAIDVSLGKNDRAAGANAAWLNDRRVEAAQAPEGRLGTSLLHVRMVGALLRELILRVAELGALDSREPAEARLMAVLMDELVAARIEPLLLPLPADERALTAAHHVLTRPADDATTDAVARR